MTLTAAHVIWGLVGAYLVTGLMLTRNVLRRPKSRNKMRLHDWAIGSVVMPAMFVFLMLCVFFEKMWARLLIVLDFNPPEEMRAGPKDPEDGPQKS
jgi:ABC-type uncharacterized transport system permease subunit